MKQTTRDWIDIAERDHEAALRLLAPPVMVEHVYYLSQQCTEKYLKAILQETGRPVPRIHDLGRLSQLVVDILPQLALLEADLDTVATFAFSTRYPFADAPVGNIDEEAELPIATMTSVRRIVRAYLDLSSEDEE